MSILYLNKTKWFSDQCFCLCGTWIEEYKYIAMKTLKNWKGNIIHSQPFFLMMIDGLCIKKEKKNLSQSNNVDVKHFPVVVMCIIYCRYLKLCATTI